MSGIFIFSAKERNESTDKSVDFVFDRFYGKQEACHCEIFKSSFVSAGVRNHRHYKCGGISRKTTETDDHVALSCGTFWFQRAGKTLSSTEALLKHFDFIGSDVSTASGNYLFAFIDAKKNKIVIENDYFGVYPAYYAINASGDFIFSSDIKTILPFITPTLNLLSVSEYLAVGYIVSYNTLINGVFRLPPNSKLLYEKGKVSIKRLRRSPFKRNEKSADDLVEHAGRAFNNAIERYKSSSNMIVASLSGGLDSRCAIMAAKNLEFDVMGYSVGEKRSLECKIARQFSNMQRIKSHAHIFNGENFPNWFERAVLITEGRCPPGHMHFIDAIFCGSNLLISHPQLHGLIGDAVVGGDLDFDKKNICFDQLTNKIARSFVYWPSGAFDKIFKKPVANCEDIANGVYRTINSQLEDFDDYSKALWFRYYFRVFGFTIPCLSSQILPWTDGIFPFLDRDFFDICSGISLEKIKNRKFQVKWATSCFPGIEKVPRVKDGVLVDFADGKKNQYESKIKMLELKNKIKYYISRASCGHLNFNYNETYPMYATWYRKWPEVRKFFDSRLLSEKILDRGIWDQKTILKLIHDLRVGKNVWDALASVLLVEVFCQMFID